MNKKLMAALEHNVVLVTYLTFAAVVAILFDWPVS